VSDNDRDGPGSDDAVHRPLLYFFFLLLCLGGIRWKALAAVIGRVSIPFYLYPAQSRMTMRPLLSWTQPMDASALLVARSWKTAAP